MTNHGALRRPVYLSFRGIGDFAETLAPGSSRGPQQSKLMTMKLQETVEVSQRIAATSRRLEKIGLLADFLRRLSPDEIPAGVSYLSGNLRQGKIGVGYASLRDTLSGDPAPEPSLLLMDVDAAFARIAATSGPGSASARAALLRGLLTRATSAERDFLARLVTGELRQGSLEGIMVEAVARAAGIPAEPVRRALMLTGNLEVTARVALQEGHAGLSRFDIRLFHPVQPMLASTAEDVEDALATLGRAALEYKLDGARMQAHKSGSDVRIFTRQLNDVTESVPEIVEVLEALPQRELILDGEALALRADGRPHPFQITMRRFGRKLDVERMREELPLTSFFFDCLFRDEERFSLLRDSLPERLLVPRMITDAREEALAFSRSALGAGHEGIMAKAPNAPYEAGGRGKSWLKIKPSHTLDLVVLAAEWGHGRRRGRLSNLHLGARDPASGQFVMLGKTFKGLTDEMLAWQTQRLLALETSRDAWTVYVQPELVVEVAFNDIQTSPHYPAGLALRFARVRSYRTDKPPAQADTIETVRTIYQDGLSPRQNPP